MTVLIAPDKFKGTLSAAEVCTAIKEGVLSVDETVQIIELPLADGGEGTCALLTTYAGGTLVPVRVRDPLFRNIEAQFGISKDGKTAFLEMASASGLQLLSAEERNPMATSTVGTGDLIRYALDQGVEHIIMGIGGSGTTDAGMGMAEALGVVFRDVSGNALKPVGANMEKIAALDLAGIHHRLGEVQFTIFCDVDNPLHGEKGAAYIFSPQKGADAAMVRALDRGLQHFEQVVGKAVHRVVNFPGAGAGGGLPASIKAFANVEIRPGMEYISTFTQLEEKIKIADLIITGEGKIDDQTLSGKVVKGIADLAIKHRKVVFAIAGKSELSAEAVGALAIEKVFTLVDHETSEVAAIQHAFSLVRRRAASIMRSRMPG